ncbi:MAG: NAD-dependent epimerase/dehydratase family protein [Solirubrobacteraceae bacterium]
MSSCLIVGGGFLGSHVAQRLSAQGHTVVVYSRSFNDWLLRRDRSSGGRIELAEGELPPGRSLRELIDAADVVFYMAGVSTPAMAQTDPGGSIMSSVVPAAALLDLMRATSTRRLVLASSGGTVYGAVTKLPTAEDHPTKPISLHGHNSLTIERYAMFFAEQHGFEPVILRYSNPYGPGQLARRGQGVVAAWCEALAHDETITLYGDGRARRDFVFIEDAAEATALAGLEAAGSSTYNVGSGQSSSLQDLLEELQRVAGRHASVQRIHARPVDVPATQLDCTRLERDLGWKPTTSLRDGLRASWAWALQVPYERRG